MKIFIDTAALEDIQEAENLGILDGVTTNPSLMAKLNIQGEEAIHRHYQSICAICPGKPVSAEVLSTKYEEMIREGEQLFELNKAQIVVKIPMTEDGLKALVYFKKKNIPTNCTLIFSSAQALLAAKAGATYVSPFIGRLDDIAHNGIEVIQDIRTIFDNYQIDTQILAASIRHVQHVVQSALAGADVSTTPLAAIKKLIHHPLTDKGLAQFVADSKNLH
ncbi:MAG: fructose-6-phosphate aldolase [Flavobacteriales bacterium]